ncbi:hypothetical protein SPURM210S_08424 [Streptomyces purpurascens]
MGSVRKASAWLGLVDDNGDERYYDDDYSDGTESGEAWVTDPRVEVASDVAEERGRPASARSPGQPSGTPAPSASCSARACRSS